MSAEAARKEQPLMESEQEISDALVLLYKLPDEAIASIHEAKRSLGLAFHEAAIHTGLVTERELEAAAELVRRRTLNQGRGIIEEAMQRRSHTQDLVVWEGPRLHAGKELILAHDPYCDRSETIRTLRTELLMRTNGRRGAGVFALLSASAGEGRSLLAAELAIAFAQLGSRTLLIDADLRRPRQHLFFGGDNSVGLSQCLLDGAPPRFHGIEGLPQMALLTSGVQPNNPLELLSGSRFERLLGEWRRNYQFIIIDTPPAEKFSDALAVASLAGNVVVVSRTNSTTFSTFNELRRKLETTNAWIVGAVMNNF